VGSYPNFLYLTNLGEGGEHNELILGKYPRMGKGEVEKLKEEGGI
jgi:hypothetical protein